MPPSSPEATQEVKKLVQSTTQETRGQGVSEMVGEAAPSCPQTPQTHQDCWLCLWPCPAGGQTQCRLGPDPWQPDVSHHIALTPRGSAMRDPACSPSHLPITEFPRDLQRRGALAESSGLALSSHSQVPMITQPSTV